MLRNLSEMFLRARRRWSSRTAWKRGPIRRAYRFFSVGVTWANTARSPLAGGYGPRLRGTTACVRR